MHKIEQHIKEHWNHLKTATIYVACSGGVDSIVLLTILKRLNYNVHAIHVNYQLREQDSEDDAAFVKQYAQKHGIPFQCKTVNLKY